MCIMHTMHIMHLLWCALEARESGRQPSDRIRALCVGGGCAEERSSAILARSVVHVRLGRSLDRLT